MKNKQRSQYKPNKEELKDPINRLFDSLATFDKYSIIAVSYSQQ